MRFLKENWSALLTILFLIAVGVLLLVDPATFAVAIVKIAGIVLAALGVYDIIKYFRATPEEAAKGSAFYSGAVLILAGIFAVFSGKWFLNVSPAVAVLYGVFQVLLGCRKLQRMVDALRLKSGLWWIRAISAGVSLLFGLVIVLNPHMTLMSIWIFTGLTMIVEGAFDAAALVLQSRKPRRPAEGAAGSEAPAYAPEPQADRAEPAPGGDGKG